MIVVTVHRVSDSSRDTVEGAGWTGAEPGSYRQLLPARVRKLSWLDPRVLWAARNGVVASWFGDPTGRTRSRWVAQRAAAGAPADKVIRRPEGDDFSFLVIGDTGAGDDSQYAVVPGLLKAGQGTAFAVIASDVIYPVGSTDDYGTKFFRPYQDYPAPIYAIPGNHDWYEDLGGFMRVFCDDAPPLPPEPEPRPPGRAWWRALLWHRPRPADEQSLTEARKLRSQPGQQADQPGPYWAIDAGPLRIVGIDTGLLGTIDAEQGAWLREVSRGPARRSSSPDHRCTWTASTIPAPSTAAAPSTTSCATRPTAMWPRSAATSTTTSATRSTWTAAPCSTSSPAAGARSCTPPTPSRASRWRTSPSPASAAIRCAATPWPSTARCTPAGCGCAASSRSARPRRWPSSPSG